MNEPNAGNLVARLRNCDCIPHCLCAEAASEIERLREQRDEARMEVCMIRAWKTDWWNMDDAMRQYAAQRGWEMPKPEPIPEPETEGNDDAGT